MNTISSTSYPDVNEIVHVLFTRVQGILGDQLVGMYLEGSLANGGFDENSDIDVIVVTASTVSEKIFLSLQEMHKQIATLDSPWAIQFEVSYIPQRALRRFDPADNLHPNLERGGGEKLKLMHHESDWLIHRHILRERGISITGPDPKTLIDPVSPDDLRRGIVEVLPFWFDPIFSNPSEIRKRGYQSFFVLSLCRMLYTLKYGEIIPKQAAAEWAKEHLDAGWQTLIERALVGRQSPWLDAEPEDIQGTLDMMRYMLEQTKPTFYPDVNEVLKSLLSNAREILDDQFVGMYLYGSLSSGEFNPETSDIDFLIVTTDTLADEAIARLESMHRQLWSSRKKWAGKLEGAYVPQALIRFHNPEGVLCPSVNEGQFYMARLGSDWIIQRHVVRECGVVLAGPDPATLIDPINSDDIRSAIRGILREWWFPMLNDPSWLANHGSEYHAYAILTMCRALHALEHGTIVSKPAAAHWAQDQLGERWKQIIELAILAQKPGSAQTDLLSDALEFIRYTKETSTS
ncbi:MAG TPA: aminoglycoside adenylyltransferase domain-containing protein [Anaerolineales bacterium]|nr:aminoglycoside adenylyltransferase domain-containing protein [Anaerolineales bacterium]